MSDQKFPVEQSHVLMFARSVGYPEERYVTGEAAVPPTFVQASAQFDPDYPLRPKLGEPWFGSGREAGLAIEGAGGLHAEQHYEYHRPVRIGDVLTPSTRDGETWTKEGRSGILHFRETITEYRDQAGELVVTARGVGVRREAK